MSISAVVLPIIQTTVQGFVQYKVATETRKIAIKTARVYIQGVRVARLVALAGFALGALALLNIFALMLTTHAAYIIYTNSPGFEWTSWVWGELGTSAAILLLDIGVIITIASERLWMRLFKVPVILETILKS